MNTLTQHFEQLRLFCEQHIPVATSEYIVPVAVLALVVGVLFSVVGAKLARAGLTLAFVGLGAYGGFRFSGLTEIPPPLAVIGGGLMIGVIGFVTFRLWVGAAIGALVTAAVMGNFTAKNLLPYLQEFEQTQMPAVQAAATTGEFSVPTPEENGAMARPKVTEIAQRFWDFVLQRDASLEQRALVHGIAAAVIGLFIGVLTVRWALVLATSILGTVMVAGGAAALFMQFFPGSYESFAAHPAVGGVAIGTFFMTSFLLQAMLTRAAPKSDGPAAAKN